MKYILGIDQGASKTHVIIGDNQGNILALSKSHGACQSTTGIEFAMKQIETAVEIAYKQSGLNRSDIDIVYAGISGADWEHEYKLIKEAIIQTLNIDNVVVVNDSIIAMRAGTKQPYGAVLCAGSGLNCAVISPSGEEFVYGYYIEKEYHGGEGLGNASLRAVFDAEVGLQQKTILTDFLLKNFSCEKVEQLLYKKVNNEISLEEILQIPRLLDKAALIGDEASINILKKFGAKFAQYITAALRKMELLNYSMDVVATGGIFKCESTYLREAFTGEINKYAPLANIIESRFEPIIGAYLRGIDKLSEASKNKGYYMDIIYNNLKNNSKDYNIIRRRELY